MKARKSGFTLIEILIVVIILGILAAIVIPQFTEASSEARESTLVSNLQTLRSQIGLYKVQHNDEYPDTTSSATFIACMTGTTDVDGNVVAGGDFGPYMQALPDNPFATNDPVDIRIAATVDMDKGAGGGEHWCFDTDTGNLWADDDEANSDGVDHCDL